MIPKAFIVRLSFSIPSHLVKYRQEVGCIDLQRSTIQVSTMATALSVSPSVNKKAHYSPPWQDVVIIGIAGSSGSGKSTVSHAIVSKLNLPWVVILSMVKSLASLWLSFADLRKDSFYKSLTPEESRKAFRNEYDFDSPDAIDFDVLVERLRDLKAG